MSEGFSRTLKIGLVEYEFHFQPVRDDVLSELYYIVTYKGIDFIMAYDFETLQFKVQGTAPYDARLFENELGSIIEGYND